MNKMNCTPGFYWFGPAALFSLVVLGGCAGSSTDVRYDETSRIYTSSTDGVNSTAAQGDSVTAHYVAGKDGEGVTSTIGQYDNATDRYTLRQGGRAAPQSEYIKVTSAPSEDQAADLPMVIEVTDVLFEFDKWVIKAPYLPELDRWVEYFQDNPMVTAEVYGHTDSTGPSKYNQTLSQKRAQAVINYLVDKGVASRRLSAQGFGESQPRATNKTKEGRQENRRVEMNL